jgi:hypothetical protein
MWIVGCITGHFFSMQHACAALLWVFVSACAQDASLLRSIWGGASAGIGGGAVRHRRSMRQIHPGTIGMVELYLWWQHCKGNTLYYKYSSSLARSVCSAWAPAYLCSCHASALTRVLRAGMRLHVAFVWVHVACGVCVGSRVWLDLQTRSLRRILMVRCCSS